MDATTPEDDAPCAHERTISRYGGLACLECDTVLIAPDTEAR